MSEFLDAAVEYAQHHWPVFPLRGKVPAIPGGRGVLDATIDLDTITAWWSGPYRGANIGGRVPESMVVIDVDPRHGGHQSVAALPGRLPETLTTLSGRGDGGRHLFYRRPPGRLSAAQLGPGIDIKTSSGYVLLAPSVHPATGKPYRRIDRPVATPPAWLTDLIVDRPRMPAQHAPRSSKLFWHGGSIIDSYASATSWADILMPHGWACRDADPDADGARWLHPRATSSCSATLRNGCLFVYSPNTPFDVTEASNPNGYTKFRAYAVLNHGGDMKAAARALKGGAR
jgi:hypothetical protein